NINVNNYITNEQIVNGLIEDENWSSLLDLAEGIPEDVAAGGGVPSLALSSAVNSLFRFHSGDSIWTGIIDALKENGLAKVLAEPTLIALSGQTAEFLAGGEFPILVPNDDGLTVEYKDFGVALSFSPTVLDNGKISMQVAPSVSELDYSSGVQYSGFIIPGLTTRRASTTIELSDGKSFAIAGLLSETTRDGVAKYPGLGDIPILGTLFRSKAFQKDETELVIIATPHLVKPVNKEDLPLPTDFYKEPNDLEFYLLGLMEGQEYPLKTVAGQELDGQFGHAPVQPEPGDVQEVGKVKGPVQTEG
ncbi:MAG TPA: hypothetical protein VJ934_07340, partial [Desulfomicrobiaceae bacterium]|nr:hypothetical protein [Desulfomicrobiaceae bacterium]